MKIQAFYSVFTLLKERPHNTVAGEARPSPTRGRPRTVAKLTRGRTYFVYIHIYVCVFTVTGSQLPQSYTNETRLQMRSFLRLSPGKENMRKTIQGIQAPNRALPWTIVGTC